MSDIQVCRVCLIMDVQMYNLRSSPVDSYFECIFGVNPHKHELLTQVCAECTVLIYKFYNFREKCIKGIGILQDIVRQNGKITKKYIHSIDRKSLKLASTIRLWNQKNSNLYTWTHIEEPQIEISGLTSGIALNNRQIFDIKPEKVDEDNETYKQEETEKLENEDDVDSLVDYLINIDPKEISLIDNTIRQKIIINTNNYDADEDPLELKYKIDSDELNVEQKTNEEKLFKTSADYKYKSLQSKDKKTGKKKRPIPRPKIQMKVKKQKNDKASKDGNIFDIVTLTLDEQIEEVKAQEHTTAYQSAKNKCNICFKVFHRGENAYILHMKKHNPTYPNVCKVCGYRFLKLKSLRCHERLHKLKYLCKLCPTVFSVKQQAQMHQEWHEKKVFFKCKHCRKKFRQSSTYINHIRLKHPSPYVCHICGYSFLSALGLEQHRNFIHKDVKDKIMTGPWCDTCDMQFMHQQAFDKHLVQSSNHVNKIHCQPKKILASNSKES